MTDLKFKLPSWVRPERAAGIKVDVSDARMVHQARVDAFGKIDVKPGVYGASVRLPDGRQLLGAVEVSEGEPEAYIDFSAEPILEQRAAQVPAKASVAANPSMPPASAETPATIAIARSTAAESSATGTAKIRIATGPGWTSRSYFAPTYTNPDTSEPLSFKAGFRNECQTLEICRPGEPTVFMQLPVEQYQQVTVEMRGGDDGALPHIAFQDPDLELLVGYVSRGLFGEAFKVGGRAMQAARDYVHDKAEHPVGACVGFYLMLRFGVDDISASWAERLVGLHPWLPDSVVILAEVLARDGRHDDARRALLELCTRGQPLFAVALSYSIDRLKQYERFDEVDKKPPDEQLVKLLRQLRETAAHVVRGRPILTYTGRSCGLADFAGIEAPELANVDGKWRVANQTSVPQRSGARPRGLSSSVTTTTPRVAMDEAAKRVKHVAARNRHNEQFVRHLEARRPSTKARHVRVRERVEAEHAARAPQLEMVGDAVERPPIDEMVFETIVSEERPVLFVQDDWVNKDEVTIIGLEAQDLVDDLLKRRATFSPLMPLVGRIDVTNFPGIEYVGTGWFVAPDVVVTNRHVATLIARWDGRQYAFSRGVAGRTIVPTLSTAHEFDDLAPDASRSFPVEEVLYIEPDTGDNDIAFIRVKRRTNGAKQDVVKIAQRNAAEGARVLVVGYPARASRDVIPDQQMMKNLYRDRFDVKRAAPGLVQASAAGPMKHDCTTLGGNSGSVVFDMDSGAAVGLHFAGLYQESNFGVPASVLSDYVNRKRWVLPRVETARPVAADEQWPGRAPAAQTPTASTPAASSSVTITIPISLTLTVGSPVTGVGGGTSVTAAAVVSSAGLASAMDAESAAKEFWKQRPAGVLAVRVGFREEGGAIGDTPIIAASALAGRIEALRATAPKQFGGFEVAYSPADVAEQIDSIPQLESVNRIAYDDDKRTGTAFSFAQVDEDMNIIAHVGPEYSWDELKSFLGGANESLVSAMYEFHGSHIADAIENRLDDGVSLKLVLDNASFSKVRDGEEEFDRAQRFEDWERFGTKFERIVAPEGVTGLISDSYHIKVTVREDDTFWLSSGNWKMSSSQPIITQEQRDDSQNVDLPGNREWHVVVHSATLANRFKKHILQDLKRSRQLGGGSLPPSHEAAAEMFVDVPIEVAPVLERRPPAALMKPKTFQGRRKVKPLLTPDQKGAVYSDAVLDLIESATESLLFQIPYIGMPSDPTADRGFIDDLITALTKKLKTLPDARLILRSGGSKFSAPTHTAWFLKSKGVDIQNRVRQIENHHTKGMVVDGRRLLLGSHNWSKPGVTLNRDASLLFDDEDLAGYYAEAFEIDWKRSNKITPREFVKTESTILEAVGPAPPPGYRRVPFSELLKDDD